MPSLLFQVCLFLLILTGGALESRAAETERFVALDGMVIVLPTDMMETQFLAIRHFRRELERLMGNAPAVLMGGDAGNCPALWVGIAEQFDEAPWVLESEDEDIRKQSYVIDLLEDRDPPVLVAAGFGTGDSARASLGTSYALSELVRRLDIREGRWGFVLPASPILASPATPDRTFYHMNAEIAAPGLSLDFMSPEEIEAYVDFLVDARYSRVTFFQWNLHYLYPGNHESRRPANQRIANAMRHFLRYAQRRGLEAYAMLTPSHIDVRQFLDDPRLIGSTTNPDPLNDTGFLFYMAVCWSQPEARELARSVMQHQMEVYAPLDGYTVWFWDPGGCLCPECAEHQADRILDQFKLVVDLAQTLSPHAQFQACLWPTWGFHNFQPYGLPFTEEQSHRIATDFQERILLHFAHREVTIMDGGEDDFTNLFNGLVDASQFRRNAFIYRVLGQQGECGYPFALFRIRYQHERFQRIKDVEMDEATLFTVFNTPNRPAIQAFADILYERDIPADDVLRRIAARDAKGDAQEQYFMLLQALEDLTEDKPIDRHTSLETDFGITPYDQRESALTRAEEAWRALSGNPYFRGDRDWLEGFVMAQRHYLEMARAKDEETFTFWYDGLLERLRDLPIYEVFIKDRIHRRLVVENHLVPYWRGPAGDDSTVGLGQDPVEEGDANP